jgi:hypothetical protein
MRVLLRLFAAAAFAVVVAASWVGPSEAHAGHDGASAAAQSREPAPRDGGARQAAEAQADERTAADEADCHGAGAADISGCCGEVCHAAMSVEPGTLRPLPIAAIAGPAASEPAARRGPPPHIRRPPRAPAAKVG